MNAPHPRRRSRRTSQIAVLAATVLVAAACSSKGPGASSAPTGGSTAQAAGANGSCPTAHKRLNLAFVYTTTLLNPFQEMALGAAAAAQQDGNVNLLESAPPQTDGPAEVSLFEAATHIATDGIAYETVFPDLFVRPLNQASALGIPLVAVDSAPPAGTQVTTYVGNSNTDLGIQLGDAFAAQHPNPNGEVVLGNDIPALPLLEQRIDGVILAIKAKLPHMKIIGPLDSQNAPAATYSAWKGFVSAYPNASGFIGVGSEDGVDLPLLQQQTHHRFLAGSADVPPQALTAVKDGYLFALSSPEHWMKGYIAMHLLIESKRTCKPMPAGWWNSGNLLITQQNIDSILARQTSPQARFNWFKPVIAEQLANPPLKPLSEAN